MSLRRGRGADGSDPAEGEVARAADDAARGVGPEAAAALSSLASLRSGGNTPGGAAIASADRAAAAECRRLTHGGGGGGFHSSTHSFAHHSLGLKIHSHALTGVYAMVAFKWCVRGQTLIGGEA